MRTLGYGKFPSFPTAKFLLRKNDHRSFSMSGESTTFEVIKKDGAARTGILRHSQGQTQTPALLIYTRRGSPLHLTPDLVQHLGEAGRNTLIDVTKL